MVQGFPETKERFIYSLTHMTFMNPSEQRILLLYKKDPSAVFSTTEIVRSVDPETYESIESILKDAHSTKESIKKAKRDKAKLHRKLLYYLTKLVKEGVLKLVKEGSKGEKFFTLSLEEGEELVVEKYKKRQITISKPRTPAMPTEGYENLGIVSKVEEPTWIDRLNCLFCECKVINNVEKLFGIINNSFNLVNDCIGINNFEVFIDTSADELSSYLNKLDDDCRDFGKRISFNIDVDDVDEDKLVSFVKSFASNKYVNLNIIFEMGPKSIRADSSLFETIISILSQNGVALFIKNKSLAKSPYCFGKGGLYCFNGAEWKDYSKNVQGKVSSLSCGQSSLSVDVKKYYDRYGFSGDSFERFVINCAESLLSANSIHRRKAAEFFDYLVNLNEPYTQQVFMLSRNYLRFWNYGFLTEKFGVDFTIDLLRKVEEKVSAFTFSEETIYKSCGMPTRFKVAVTSSINSESENQIVRQDENLQSTKVKKKLNICERKSDVLEGSVMVEFVRHGILDTQEIAREWILLLSSYKLPFFVYRFKKAEGVNLRLDAFLGGKK